MAAAGSKRLFQAATLSMVAQCRTMADMASMRLPICTPDTAGIVATSGNKVIIKNTANLNITNLHVVGDQRLGPLITASGMITNVNPRANFAQ